MPRNTEKTFIQKPNSVYRAMVVGGVMGSDKYLNDKEGFVSIVLGKWYHLAGNTLSCETEAHEDAAEKGYELYANYRAAITEQGFHGKLFIGMLRFLVAGNINAASTEFDKVIEANNASV